MIEFYLFISVGLLAWFFFCNEQLEPTNWPYTLNKPNLTNVSIQIKFQTFKISPSGGDWGGSPPPTTRKIGSPPYCFDPKTPIL